MISQRTWIIIPQKEELFKCLTSSKQEGLCDDKIACCLRGVIQCYDPTYVATIRGRESSTILIWQGESFIKRYRPTTVLGHNGIPCNSGSSNIICYCPLFVCDRSLKKKSLSVRSVYRSSICGRRIRNDTARGIWNASPEDYQTNCLRQAIRSSIACTINLLYTYFGVKGMYEFED